MTPRAIITAAGGAWRVSQALGLALQTVYNNANAESLPAAWKPVLEDMTGAQLPWTAFKTKGMGEKK